MRIIWNKKVAKANYVELYKSFYTKFVENLYRILMATSVSTARSLSLSLVLSLSPLSPLSLSLSLSLYIYMYVYLCMYVCMCGCKHGYINIFMRKLYSILKLEIYKMLRTILQNIFYSNMLYTCSTFDFTQKVAYAMFFVVNMSCHVVTAECSLYGIPSECSL